MDTGQNARTVPVKPCAECEGGLMEYDRFCRWCGVRQPAGASFRLPETTRITELEFIELSGERRLCKKVSGPLIDAVIDGMAPSAAVAGRGSFGRGALLAIVSLPMWL